jgi:hypothetical protein
VWDDPFPLAALAEALKAIKEEGIGSFPEADASKTRQ